MGAVAVVVFVVGAVAFVVGVVLAFVVAAVSALALALAVLVSLFSCWEAVECSSKKFRLFYKKKVSLHCRRGTSFWVNHRLIIMDKYKYIK